MEVKSMVQTAQAQVGTEEREEPPAPRLSWSQIEDYLGSLERRGCAPETVKSYRRNLLRFYRSLPPDKTLPREEQPRRAGQSRRQPRDRYRAHVGRTREQEQHQRSRRLHQFTQSLLHG